MNILNWLFRKNTCEKCELMRYEMTLSSEIINDKIRVKCAYCKRWKTLDNELVNKKEIDWDA